jgi:CBS domain-containing protein
MVDRAVPPTCDGCEEEWLMQVKDVMSRDVVVVYPDTDVGEAATQMQRLGDGPLPVCEGERLIGMVTEADIAAQTAAQDAHALRVQDVMTPEVVFCFEEQDTREAAHLMQQKNVHRLLVLNRASRLVGMISQDDLVTQSFHRPTS